MRRNAEADASDKPAATSGRIGQAVADLPAPRTETYEARLARDARWAMAEGDRFFDEKSSVFQTLRDIARCLNDLDIPYVVVGGLAMAHAGYRRFTEDVDMVVTTEGLRAIHDNLIGLGYKPAHRLSKNIRDTSTGVRI